jgi:hypothetical protein
MILSQDVAGEHLKIWQNALKLLEWLMTLLKIKINSIIG